MGGSFAVHVRLLGEWGAPIFSNFRTAIRKTGDTLQNIWGSILKPIWDNIMRVVDELWTDHLKPLVDNFLDFVGEFVNGAFEFIISLYLLL